MNKLPLDAWMLAIQEQMETILTTWLPNVQHAPVDLHAAMRYAVLAGGKRIRPLLVFAAGAASHAGEPQLARVAVAVELIHTYSLVHDDLPTMDNDVLRRGKPTCHVAFNEATALLAGDALQTLAFQVLADPHAGFSASTQVELLHRLALAAGHSGMAGGQAIDLDNVGKALSLVELERMHMMKTGALIRAAVTLGGMAGDGLSPEQLDALDHYAKRVGLAFQVVDDVLDCVAPTTTLGKTAGKDAADDKPTYVSLMGLSAAQQFAQELRDDANDALSLFGPAADRLRQLADYVVSRSF